MTLTAVIHPETLSTGATVYVAQCPEVDVSSQGDTRESAVANLREAVEGFFEVALPSEVERRLREGTTVERMNVAA